VQFPFTTQTEKEFDAAGFGVNAVDHLLVVPEFPISNTNTRLVEHKQGAGGQTASAIVALQRLGMRTTYADALAVMPRDALVCSRCSVKALIWDLQKQ
jgi:hypothetical protein